MTESLKNGCPRLIEVALPIREISAESVREKSLRHGHISTLHLWWARRPLAASRAVAFASLVPDPDDPRCPEDFRTAVERHLKTHVSAGLKHYIRKRNAVRDEDPYRPYDGIADTLRNRLLMFIAKWSPEALFFEAGKSTTAPKPENLLDDRSLVRWETSDPSNPQGKQILEVARELVRLANHGNTPVVLDPFAGGGAIPLEAGRVGAQPIANDYNPVAYLILKATCEFPQKYGKPGKREVLVDDFGKTRAQERDVTNVLVHDFEKWAIWVLRNAKERVGHLYPPGPDGRPVIGYLWARTVPCTNPSCRGQIPLLRSLVICNRKDKKIGLAMEIDKKRRTVRFRVIAHGGKEPTLGTTAERGAICPYCEQAIPTEHIKRASFEAKLGERIVAVIVEDAKGKDYRSVTDADERAFTVAQGLVDVTTIPSEAMPESPDLVSGRGWNFKTWGSLFNARQLVAMQALLGFVEEAVTAMEKEGASRQYIEPIAVYLALWVSRCSMFQSNMGLWKPSGEFVAAPFSMQAIPMVWDYPEISIFADASGGAAGQLDWMKRFMLREACSGLPARITRGDGSQLDLPSGTADVVITDPPYFDAIAYADLSDFFYVWLKRMLSDITPEAVATPLTPKGEEATAVKHRHKGDPVKADTHFKKKLGDVLREGHRVLRPGGVVAVMFAHQSTKAWSALISALFDAELSIDATWPIDTEREVRSVALGTSALASSITVVCRPRVFGAAASYKDVKKQVENTVSGAIKRFWSYGLRGADLIVASYGPAVGVFGKYAKVEKADGTPVGIPELLELARGAARDAIAGEFRGDNLSTLYYVWANLYGAGEQAWDDARLIVQIGGDSGNAMEVARNQGIFVVDGATCRLALLADRKGRRGLGMDPNPPLIDALHRAMLLWKLEKRSDLVAYLAERGLTEDGPFWKLAQALFDVLPRDSEDWKLVGALLSERPTLRREQKQVDARRRQAKDEAVEKPRLPF